MKQRDKSEILIPVSLILIGCGAAGSCYFTAANINQRERRLINAALQVYDINRNNRLEKEEIEAMLTDAGYPIVLPHTQKYECTLELAGENAEIRIYPEFPERVEVRIGEKLLNRALNERYRSNLKAFVEKRYPKPRK